MNSPATAHVDRLLVTHVPPWNSPDVAAAEAGRAFDGTIEVVRAAGTYRI